MAPETKVAGERTIIRNPAMDDPNAGIIVAAGDPIPIGAGIISNTPNKVDAAANYDEVDAADKAATPARRDTVVTSLSPESAAAQAEIVERVQANRSSWDEEQRTTAAPVDASEVGLTAPAGASRTEATSTSDTSTPANPADMTVAELDAAYGDVDGYPKSAAKADKVAFANSTRQEA